MRAGYRSLRVKRSRLNAAAKAIATGAARDGKIRETMTMSYAADSALSSTGGSSGAALVRNIVCRIYGVLAVLVGLFGVAVGAVVTWLWMSGRTLDFLDGSPLAIGPYLAVCSLVTVVLGVLIFRQSVIAAITLLAVTALTDLLGHFVPALSIPAASGSFTIADAILYAILLVVTAVIVIADRAARRAGPRR